MTSSARACPAGFICPGGALTVSCDIDALLHTNPLTALSTDGSTVAQLVYGKGMPAGGLYCPGTSPAGPCPAGSFCPDPLTNVTCPSGHFCPMQSTAPLPCNWASHCPAGSALPSITWGAFIGIWVLVITLLIMWWAAVSLLGRSRLQHLHRTRKQAVAARLLASDGMTPAGCELARMPTLASIHSSQATICIEVQPSQPGFLGKTLGTDTISGMVLDHSRVHLLMCPESGALCQASKALCGSRKRPREWGKVQYNKEAASTRIYRNLVRHVPQDDALEPALTVAQNMQLAAHLSLPPHFTPHRRSTLVQEVLDLLALTPLQHCLVGMPGAADALTAAQRKVVAVATKLVTCPALLLIDQPLSPFNQPQHAASAAHLVRSLRTAASQLHMNIIIAEQGLQDATFGAVDNVVMLDAQALPVYAGTSNKAAAWFEYLGYDRGVSSPIAFCNSVMLGGATRSVSQDALHQGCTLHHMWDAQGQGWQQCPPPKTPPSPTPASAASQHRRSPKNKTAAAIYDGQGMCDAPIIKQWDSSADVGSQAQVNDSMVPLLQLPRGRSGNPFASLHASLVDSSPAAAAAPPGAPPSQAAAGAVVPPLALHRLPAPFGTVSSQARNSQAMQSRLAQESGVVSAASFTSTSLSYSEVPSTGYTTRSPSPDAGLKSHFLHAAHAEPSGCDDSTLAVSNPLFGCTPRRGSPDMARCDSDDYGAVNPLYSSPALVRPSPLRGGPVAEGTEERQGLREALTRQGLSQHNSSSSSLESADAMARHIVKQHGQSGAAAISTPWAALTHWWQKRGAKRPAATGDEEVQEVHEAAAEGRLRTDMITIDVPSSRCSSTSHRSQADADTDLDEAGMPLPPLSTSSSPTRRLTKQASDAAAAMLLAISDASPIPRSPKPGPAPHRSWFVDHSSRRSLPRLRGSPNALHQLQPVSKAVMLSFKHQLVQSHFLDLLVAVLAAILLGLLHGTAWQVQEVPAAALGATLALGLLSLLAALPVFAGAPARRIAALHTSWLHFLLTALLHLLMVVVRAAIFAAIYFSFVLPALPLHSLFLVMFLVSCWCTGLGYLLVLVLPANQLAASSMTVMFAVGASLNGVFPSLRQLHSSPWFLVTGLSFTRWAVEALTIGNYRAAVPVTKPVGLYMLSQHGYCGLQRIVYWDVGAFISTSDATNLLQLVQQGGGMCSTFVDHDLIALAVQTAILYGVATACYSVQAYLARRL